MMARLVQIFVVVLILAACNKRPASNLQPATAGVVGGGCDGCELMFVNMPQVIDHVDTSAGWHKAGQKLIISGKITNSDGVAASDVLLYYWHTDHNGYYSKSEKEHTIHGRLRGWVKSDTKGMYQVFTVRPASYPNSKIPAHIHFSVKEPGIANEYYIDDLLFDDDKFLTKKERDALPERGGNGIHKVTSKHGVQLARRDIILGHNIPNYPAK